MLETLTNFIISLPNWLEYPIEILTAVILFFGALVILQGFRVSFQIIVKRAKSIEEIQFFPPSIKFKTEEKE